MREMLWSLRVSELAPARSHADVACEGMRTTTFGACGSCSVAHTDTQSTESESERQRATVAVRTHEWHALSCLTHTMVHRTNCCAPASV